MRLVLLSSFVFLCKEIILITLQHNCYSSLADSQSFSCGKVQKCWFQLSLTNISNPFRWSPPLLPAIHSIQSETNDMKAQLVCLLSAFNFTCTTNRSQSAHYVTHNRHTLTYVASCVCLLMYSQSPRGVASRTRTFVLMSQPASQHNNKLLHSSP